MINEWARHVGEPEVSEADLRLVFPEMDEIPSNAAGIHTVCVHCECTLVLKMVRITSAATAADPDATGNWALQVLLFQVPGDPHCSPEALPQY